MSVSKQPAIKSPSHSKHGYSGNGVEIKSGSSSIRTRDKSPAKHALTIPLSKLKSAFTKSNNTTPKSKAGQGDKSPNGPNTPCFSPPPELVINDTTTLTTNYFDSPTTPEKMGPVVKNKKDRGVAHLKGLFSIEKKTGNETQYLTVDSCSKDGHVRQRKRSKSINIDNRSHLLVSPFLTPTNSFYSKIPLFKSNSYDPTRFSPQLEEVRKVLESKKYSPIKKLYFETFLKAHKSYNLIPTSSKLVIFDTNLPVTKAFYALLYNKVRAAPLWNSQKECFQGMLTVTDFIRILVRRHSSPQDVDFNQLASQRIQTWKTVLLPEEKNFIFIPADSTLYDAVGTLLKHRIHRLPIIDQATGNCLAILTHRRILKFIYLSDFYKPQSFHTSIEDLGIGTFEEESSGQKLFTIGAYTSTWDALKALDSYGISAIPIVDEEKRCIGLYSKADVLHLASSELATQILPVPVLECIKHTNSFGKVYYCSKNDTLNSVINKLVSFEVHRLMVLNESKQLMGIVSLSDILQFIYDNQSLEDISLNSSARDVSTISATSLLF